MGVFINKAPETKNPALCSPNGFALMYLDRVLDRSPVQQILPIALL